MTAEVDDFLQHYGVKGMHWGKHKAKGSAVEKTGGSSKEAAKADKADYKSKVKAERQKIYGQVKTNMSTPAARVTTGAALASTLIGGPSGSAIIGAQMMRSAGFSKKKSFATAMLGGAPGAVLMIELQARKNVKAANGG